MKKTGRSIWLVALLVWLCPMLTIADSIVFTEGSRIELYGESTFRKFSAVTKAINLKGVANSVGEPKAGLPWTPTEIEMYLEVKSLKSDSATLDEHMYESLNAEKFPQIQLKINEFKFVDAAVVATGNLTIAGVTKSVELKGNLKRDGNKLIVSGMQPLLMSDYGIKPPVMLLGSVKTNDKIDIVFKIICLINPNEERK